MSHGSAALDGELRLRSQLKDGRSHLVDLYRTAPFHISSQLDRHGDGRCDVIIQGVGPGHLPGDRIRVDLAAESGSTLIVRGQGANRIFSSVDDRVGFADVQLDATDGSTLIFLPGELIPYRNSMLDQTTVVRLDAMSRAILAEVITAGREGLGEYFSFRKLDLRTKVWFANRLILQERFCLEPAVRPMNSVGRNGQHPVVANLNFFGNPWDVPVPQRFRGVEWSAGQSEHLITVRLFGDTAQHVNHAIRALIDSAGLRVGNESNY